MKRVILVGLLTVTVACLGVVVLVPHIGLAGQACVHDANGDGKLDIADPIWLLHYLFSQGPPPVDPVLSHGIASTGQRTEVLSGDDGSYRAGCVGRFRDNADGTITDRCMGLMWQQTTSGTYTWQGAITYCENLSLANHDDWRMPTVEELQSIADYGRTNPAIDPVFLNVSQSWYWTSTSSLKFPDKAWTVLFGSGAPCPNPACEYEEGGAIAPHADKTHQQPVLAVRTCRFVDNGDGTVSDTKTGLMWQQETPGTYTWEGALRYCEDLDLAGHRDWRMPNVRELQSLAEYMRQNPSIDGAFTNVSQSWYWTSTSSLKFPDKAWTVLFGLGAPCPNPPGSVACDYEEGGAVAPHANKTHQQPVLAVRGGTCSP